MNRLDQEATLESHTRETLEAAYRHLKQVEAVQAQQNLFNDKCCELLKAIIPQANLDNPEQGWQFWSDYNDVVLPENANRPVEHWFFKGNRFVMARPRYTVGRNLFEFHSCFAAGTPVWTDRGPQPIEQLRVGDLALSKDIDTGELAYRPIIRTTTREPRPLISVKMGEETIVATEGHPFWVSGEGWVRARDLTAGQTLHTPTGTVHIDAVARTAEDNTYNLVVDGFHTYFVGDHQVLVHDVSLTSPTDRLVPGGARTY